MLPRVTQEQLNTGFSNYRAIFTSDNGIQIQTARQVYQSMSHDEHDLSNLNFSNTYFSCTRISFKNHVCNKLTFLGVAFTLVTQLTFLMLIYQELTFNVVKVSLQEESISKEPY